MFIKLGPEFICVEGYDQNSHVYNNRARIPVFIKVRQKIPVSERIRSELQCIWKKSQNSSVWKDKFTIPMLNRAKIPMFGTIRTDFEYFKGQDQNSNIWKDIARISMFINIRPESQCMQR